MRPDDRPSRAVRAWRTWRSARQSAVRQYGEGRTADQAAKAALKRFQKWLAKRDATTSAGVY